MCVQQLFVDWYVQLRPAAVRSSCSVCLLFIWEPEELQTTCEGLKQSLKNYEEQITVPNLSQPAPDEHLNDLQKQGFSAIQEGNK